MELSQSSLAWLYLCAFLLGIGLGAFYDIFRITRVFLGVHYSRRAANRLTEIQLPLLKPRKKRGESRALGMIVFLEDLLFCLLTGIAFILLFYELNHGKFRLIAVICAGTGFLLYRGTIGRLVMLFSELIAFVLESAVRYAVFFLIYPARLLIGFVRKRTQIMIAASVRKKKKRRRKHYTGMESERISVNACGLIPQNMPKQRNLKSKRGKKIGTAKETTVQSKLSDTRSSRHPHRGFYRNICK